MESAGAMVIKGRYIFPGIFKKKASLEKFVIEGIDSVTSMIDIMENYRTGSDHFIISGRILDLEIEIENNEKKILSVLNNRHFFPVCWKDLLQISNQLRQLFKQLVMAYNKNQIFKNIDSYSAFYEHEKRFLSNVKCFLEDYSKNRKYVYEIMINNQHELKDYMKIYFTRFNTIFSMQSEDCSMRIKALEIFEHIHETNEEIQETLGKIFIASSM